MEAQGLTIERMATLLGSSKSTVHRSLDNPEVDWTIEKLIAWGRVLGLEPQIVFTRVRRPAYLTEVGKWKGQPREDWDREAQLVKAMYAGGD